MTLRWNQSESSAIGNAHEVDVAPALGGGRFGGYTTIWVVRVGNDLFVRSYRGRGGGWSRAVNRTAAGRLRVGGLEQEVCFEQSPDVEPEVVDAVYRAKYAGSPYLEAMLSPEAAVSTMRVVPCPPVPSSTEKRGP